MGALFSTSVNKSKKEFIIRKSKHSKTTLSDVLSDLEQLKQLCSNPHIFDKALAFQILDSSHRQFFEKVDISSFFSFHGVKYK